MRNFKFIIKTTEITRWSSETSYGKFGGILLVCRKDSSGIIDGLRALPIYWDTTARNTDGSLSLPAALKIRDVNLNENANDMEFVEDLRRGNDFPIRLESVNRSTWDVLTDTGGPLPGVVEFDLCFLEAGMCKFLAEENSYYWASNGTFYTDRNLTTPVNSTDRGIIFYRAISVFEHGTNGNTLEIGKFGTLAAKPFPEPVIVDSNYSGAVAYTLTSNCPPFWKPTAQFIESMGAIFRSSAAAAEREANVEEERARKNRQGCLSIVLILLLVALSIYSYLVKYPSFPSK